jgi:hypothetical protein
VVHRLGGPTCLAGDVSGDFIFPRGFQPGDVLLFDDKATGIGFCCVSGGQGIRHCPSRHSVAEPDAAKESEAGVV